MYNIYTNVYLNTTFLTIYKKLNEMCIKCATVMTLTEHDTQNNLLCHASLRSEK